MPSLPIPRGLAVAVCLLGVISCGLQPAAADDTEPAKSAAASPTATIVLVGGRLLTQTDAGVVEGDVLIRDGKIAAVGQFEIPAGARRIDVTGMRVAPGLIDVRSCLWLTSAAAKEGASDGGLNVLDGVNPFDQDWREVVRQGITAAYVQPAATGTLGGTGAVLRVGPGNSPSQLVLRRDAGAQAALGTTSSSDTSPKRYAQYQALKRSLDAAKKYGEAWKKYEDYKKKKDAGKGKPDKSKRGESKPDDKAKGGDKDAKDKDAKDKDAGKPATTKPAAKPTTKPATAKPPTKPTRDPAKEFLLKVIRREVPLRIEAHRADDLRNALKLAEELKIRVVLEGVSSPESALETVRDSRLPLVLGPVLELAKPPTYRARRSTKWLTQLVDDDVRWALGTFATKPRGSRLLRVHAAAAVAQGADPDQVLRAITRGAAEVVGMDETLGTIEVGKQADLAVFGGHPLNPSSATRLVMSRGEVLYENEQAERAGPDEPVPAVDWTDPLPNVYVVKSQRLCIDGQFQPGQLVIENGRIASVGASAEVPEDVPTLDVGNAVVTPGLVAAHTTLGAARLLEETTDPITSELMAADVFHAASPAAKRFVRAGFLALGFAPGSSNLISGNLAAVRPAGADPVVAEAGALKIVLTGASRNVNRFPSSLAGQTELLLDTLGGNDPPTRLLLPPAVRRELTATRRARIQAAVDKQQPVIIEATTRGEIRAALQIVEKYQLRAALFNAKEIRPFIDQLKRLDVGLIVQPIGDDDYDRQVDQIAAASQRGVAVAFAGDQPHQCRMSAALVMAAGMSHQSAMNSLTNIAARLVGAPAGTATLTAQAPADFVVWSGSPLDLCHKPVHVVVDGKLVE